MSKLEQALLKYFVDKNLSCGFIGSDLDSEYQAMVLYAILSKDRRFSFQVNKAYEWGWLLMIQETDITPFFNDVGFFAAVRIHYCNYASPAQTSIFRFKWHK